MVDYNRSPVTVGQPITAWNPDGSSVHWDADGKRVEDINGYDQNIERLRERGAQPASATPQLNTTLADGARGLQLNALAMLREQARGAAPSSAAILSQRANQDAVMAAGRQMTGAKSAAGGIVAARAAGMASASQAMGANAANANARAGEISRGQGAYSGGSSGIRGQDITQATTNAQLEQAQRALNEQRQQANEQLAWDTRNQGMQNNADFIQAGRADRGQQRARERGKEEADHQAVRDGTSAVTGAIKGGLGSDPRTKTNVIQMGSLASLRRGR